MKLFSLLIALLVILPGLSACVHSAIYTARVEKAFPSSGQFVGNKGEQVHILSRGTRGPVILMIHGASANANEFTKTLAPRLEDSHRVLIADRPGHGYSQRPKNAHTLEVQARQMATALEALAPDEKAVIVGHSFGGAVALRLALDYPERVEALVLLAPVSHDWGTDATAWYSKTAARPVLGPLFAQLVPLVGPKQLEDGVAGVFHPEPAPETYIEDSAAKLLFRPSNFRANALDVVHLRGELAAQQSRYNELEMPITLYSGQRDTVIKPELHAGKLAHQVPQLEIVDLPNGGHMPQHAHAGAIADTVTALAARRTLPSLAVSQ